MFDIDKVSFVSGTDGFVLKYNEIDLLKLSSAVEGNKVVTRHELCLMNVYGFKDFELDSLEWNRPVIENDGECISVCFGDVDYIIIPSTLEEKSFKAILEDLNSKH